MDGAELDPFELALENFTCDLLALSKNQAALQRLFRARKGTWLPVKDLCDEVPGLADAFQDLHDQMESELMATWLNYPFASPKEGYVMVVFFLEDLLWSKTALFNLDTLPQPRGKKRPKQAKASR